MCAPRSLNSWDIVLEKRNGAVFLDKRDGGPFDFITVNENAFEAPADSDDAENINSASNLSLEATYINANFAGQVIASKGKFTPSPNPFYSAEDESEPLASCLYKYRKFDLSLDGDAEDEYSLVVRAEVDAYLGPDKTKHTTIKALNEYDPRATGAKTLDWRKFLDTQKGAIVAGEMKNNSAKLARWAVQSYLAGAEMMKMGYVFCTSCRVDSIILPDPEVLI
jgi:translation initiation factor 3 subunit D